jgi:hypothetical protein
MLTPSSYCLELTWSLLPRIPPFLSPGSSLLSDILPRPSPPSSLPALPTSLSYLIGVIVAQQGVGGKGRFFPIQALKKLKINNYHGDKKNKFKKFFGGKKKLLSSLNLT